jgi:alanyl-tRNA synthetase
VPRERIYRFGEKDNFWSMGDTGPCGPCTEIFWDNGPGVGCGKPDCAVGCDCDRYMEIWNNVFMQFNRTADGVLHPLPKPAVDTGMGLERITTVMQGVQSNYDTDLLQGIIKHIEQLAGKSYRANDKDDVSMRVIADHIRAMTFLICDGALPSNEGRGYVLRRIMRRAARHARMLGFTGPVLFRVVDAVQKMMGDSYPELIERGSYIKKVIQAEEERFLATLDNGLRLLNDELDKQRRAGSHVIPGEALFRLYDTFGFPADLTADIVRVEGFAIDEAGFEACMEEQRKKAREHWKGSGEEAVAAIYHRLYEMQVRTEFCGYEELTAQTEIRVLLRDGEQISLAHSGEKVEVITSATPCYGESGGQTGDRGEIITPTARARVLDTRRPLPGLFVHVVEIVAGTLREGDAVEIRVDLEQRQATALNHTATHILQAVLVEVLGDHVKQAGSLVTPERLRFDFSHFSAMTAEELVRVESEVNRRIRGNGAVETREMEAEAAIAAGATALFGEKYGERVRVVTVGDFSKELCGGTHARAAGDLGFFRILQESGVAAGVRRIEAVTGARAVQLAQQEQELLRRLATQLKSEPRQLENRLQKLLEQQRELEREVETLQARSNADQGAKLLDQVREIAGVRVLAVRLDGKDGKALRDFSDSVRDRLGSGVVVLASAVDGKANLLVAVSKDLSGRLAAGELIKPLAEKVGGKGGGRPDLAQAGGNNPEGIPAALDALPAALAALLGV